MNCTTCDYVNAADARFCNGCGAMLTAAATAVKPNTQQTVQLTPTAMSSVLAMPNVPATPNPIAPVAAPMPVAPPSVAVPVNVNVTVNSSVAAAAPSPVIVVAQQAATGPGCLVRGMYFLVFGLWFGAFWTSFAWLALVSIIGLPIGLIMLNRLPQVMTLKSIQKQMSVTVQNGVVMVGHTAVQQRSFLVRALYFVFIGWWFSGFWLATAWGLIAGTFGLALPLSFWMFNRTPAIVSLARQ